MESLRQGRKCVKGIKGHARETLCEIHPSVLSRSYSGRIFVVVSSPNVKLVLVVLSNSTFHAAS